MSVDQRFRCDVTDPSVNTPTSTTTPDDHGGRDGDHDGDHDGATRPGARRPRPRGRVAATRSRRRPRPATAAPGADGGVVRWRWPWVIDGGRPTWLPSSSVCSPSSAAAPAVPTARVHVGGCDGVDLHRGGHLAGHRGRGGQPGDAPRCRDGRPVDRPRLTAAATTVDAPAPTPAAIDPAATLQQGVAALGGELPLRHHGHRRRRRGGDRRGRPHRRRLSASRSRPTGRRSST